MRIVVCACGCGQVGRHEARGLLRACYRRARWRGQLDQYANCPTLPDTRQRNHEYLNEIHQANRQGRIEDYVELREWGYSRREAARRMGITDRTAVRYHHYLREQGHTYDWLYQGVPEKFLNGVK